MDPWLVVTAVSGAVVALVVVGGAVVLCVKRPFRTFHAEIAEWGAEDREAHEKILADLERLGERIDGCLR